MKKNIRYRLKKGENGKYNPDNIFKNDNNVFIGKKENISVEDVAIIDYKESFFKRICNKIKRFLGLALGNNLFAYYIGRYEYDNKNYQEAKKYFEIALDEKYDDSYFYLGTMYYEGYGVERNLEKANEYFLKIEKDMLKSSIYLSLALEEKIEFDSLIIKLRTFKKLKEIALKMKKSHPYRKYYLRINTLSTSAIDFVVNNYLVPFLQEYLKSNIFRQNFKNEDEVEFYVDSILK